MTETRYKLEDFEKFRKFLTEKLQKDIAVRKVDGERSELFDGTFSKLEFGPPADQAANKVTLLALRYLEETEREFDDLAVKVDNARKRYAETEQENTGAQRTLRHRVEGV